MRSHLITEQEYNMLLEAKKRGNYANIIRNSKCPLGRTHNFKVIGTKNVFPMRCTQIGGMRSGSHCFVML